MSKAKGPKLGISFLNSLQICRPKNPSSMIKGPLHASTYSMFSPMNSKTFDISIPTFPSPPPSTPSSKFTPFGFGNPSNSCKMQEDEFKSHTHTSKSRNEVKICSSPVTSDPDDNTYWQAPPPLSITEKKKDKNKTKKSKASVSTSFFLGESQETDSLFSSPPSFNSSHDFNHPLKPVKQTSVTARRFKRYGSKEWKEGVDEYHGKKQTSMVDGKVNQSFVVVKRSVDPYEDFKRSMYEMILEKQMFEPKELEHLLMSFLSLNSKLHHKVIIEAFTEILKEVFCG